MLTKVYGKICRPMVKSQNYKILISISYWSEVHDFPKSKRRKSKEEKKNNILEAPTMF